MQRIRGAQAAALLTLVLLGNLYSSEAQAAKPPAPRARTECQTLLTTGGSVVGFDDLFDSYTIDDLLNTDPSSNLVHQYPSIAMDSFQRAWAAVKLSGAPRRILEPTYRARKVDVWPAFHDGLSQVGGRYIVGQYDAVGQLVDLLQKGAQGNGIAERMLHFVGPGGTGKTELISILATLLLKGERVSPGLRRWTFDWVNLDQVPALKRLAGSSDGTSAVFENSFQRSPLTLIEYLPALRDRVTALADEPVQAMIGLKAHPFTTPDPKTEAIIRILIEHYAKKEGVAAITEEFFLDVLRRHVRIRPYRVSQTAPTRIIDYQGKNPDFEQLLWGPNLLARAVLGQNHPLATNFTGKILEADGGALLVDEFFRQDPVLRDLFLQAIENRILARDGIALSFDSVIMGTSNGESVTEAAENGPVKALIQRTIPVPMRLSTNPTEVVETALLMEKPRLFGMRNLSVPGAPITPLVMKEVFPLPGEDGRLQGPDGRYAIYYLADPEHPVLIAPHSLILFGLVASATRMVTDPGAAKHLASEFDLVKQAGALFTSVTDRLDVVMGAMTPTNAVRRELDSLQVLLREGEVGFSQRHAELLLSNALTDAIANNEDTLTPASLDRVFMRLFEVGTEDFGKGNREKWIEIARLIKAHFIIPRLAKDLTQIMGGDSTRVEQIYREMKREIMALGTNPDAREYEDGSGGRRPINRERLSEVKKAYRAINGRELQIDELKNFHASSEDASTMHQPLKRAIERWVLNTALKLETIDALIDAYDGRSTDPTATSLMGRVAGALERSGYNKRALYEAMRLIRDLKRSEQQ